MSVKLTLEEAFTLKKLHSLAETQTKSEYKRLHTSVLRTFILSHVFSEVIPTDRIMFRCKNKYTKPWCEPSFKLNTSRKMPISQFIIPIFYRSNHPKVL